MEEKSGAKVLHKRKGLRRDSRKREKGSKRKRDLGLKGVKGILSCGRNSSRREAGKKKMVNIYAEKQRYAV